MKKFPDMLPWLCIGILFVIVAPLSLSPREWLSAIGIAILFPFFMTVILESLSFLKTRSLRRIGLFPPKKKATLEDVKQLLQAGERIHAIKLYRSLQRVSLPDAVQAIDKMQTTL